MLMAKPTLSQRLIDIHETERYLAKCVDKRFRAMERAKKQHAKKPTEATDDKRHVAMLNYLSVLGPWADAVGTLWKLERMLQEEAGSHAR